MSPVIRMVGNLEVRHVLTHDMGIYQIYDFPKRLRACPSTCTPAVFTNDRRHARPSLLTLPVTNRSIGHKGPPV